MAKVNDDPDEIEVQLKYYATDSYTSEYEFQVIHLKSVRLHGELTNEYLSCTEYWASQ